MLVPLKDETHHRGGFPYAVVGLIAANVIVFILELANGPQWALQYALVPSQIVHGQNVYTIITSMFIHGGWLHIGGNMIYLWVFGDELDADYMGSLRFLAFYFICGITATALQILVDPWSTVPNLGASGAIAGVLGGFIIVFPRDDILTAALIPFPIPLHLSALLLIGFWFVLQLVSGVLSINALQQDVGGVAYFAHVGGFVAGMALVKLFVDRALAERANSR